MMRIERDYIPSDNIDVIRLYDDKGKIGHIQYTIDFSCRTVYINHLYISDEHRRKGLASFLVREVINDAKVYRVKKAELDCINTCSKEHNLFYEVGFRFVVEGRPEMEMKFV